MRPSAVAAALLLTACTNGAPDARPTTPPPVTRTPSPTVTPYVSADPRCAAPASSATSASGQTFAFAGARTGIVMQGPLSYRTTDGGATWRPAHEFESSLHALVAAGCGTLYASSGYDRFTLDRSDDGGATWHRVSGTNVQPVAFVTPDAGYALRYADPGLEFFATRDGGRAWRRLAPVQDAEPTLAAGSGGVVLAGAIKRLLRSADGGGHFAEVLHGDVVHAVALDGDEAWAVGRTDHDTNNRWLLWHSADRGARWALVASGVLPSSDRPGPYLAGAVAAYGGVALVAGTDGVRATISVTSDGGRTLRRAALAGTEPESPYEQAPLVDRIQWVDARHAFASLAGVPTRLFATADAGASWREIALP
jgi:photosystem II stability/assembly factor-like uncharacterized protein